MFQIIGIVLLFVMVFGSFIISGGKIAVVLEALPHELMAIEGRRRNFSPDPSTP